MIPKMVLSAVALGALCACARAPEPPIGSVKVPAHADLRAIRGVQVSLSPAPGRPALSGTVELQRPDGKVVYRARLESGALTARVALPSKDQALIAVLHRPGLADLSLQLPVVGDAAQGSLQ